jgi:hypothetical protein
VLGELWKDRRAPGGSARSRELQGRGSRSCRPPWAGRFFWRAVREVGFCCLGDGWRTSLDLRSALPLSVGGDSV